MNNRIEALKAWISDKLCTTEFRIDDLAGDASFRRYYRVSWAKESLIAMDASSDSNSLPAFIEVAELFSQTALIVPQILHAEKDLGFALISDLGDRLLSTEAPNHYNKALDCIVTLQQGNAGGLLPTFDERHILRELGFFQEWFIQGWLSLELSEEANECLNELYLELISNALSQPQVIIHRDYHSRNIMILPNDELALIDFQDAMIGPISYDLVSLIKDCYIKWSTQQQEQWAGYFYQQLCDVKLLKKVGQNQFHHWYSLMGLQRHLKVIGIFSRLHLRDNKAAYLQDLPRCFEYILEYTRNSKNKRLHNLMEVLNAQTLKRLQDMQRESVA